MTSPLGRNQLSRSAILALACCLFALVVGARWALIADYGTDLPEADQWDAEGLALLSPAAQGQLHMSAFLLPHNEHRIVLTRLLAFGLTQANGQWDQRIEAACNALLPATIAAAFWILAAARLQPPWQLIFWAALAALYALPTSFENVLNGFDSQQFFLIGLAFASISLLPFAEPFLGRWWLGALCVVLSLGSMGSGFLAAVVVAGLLLWQLESGERSFRSAAPGLVVCAGAIAAGVMTRVIVPGHLHLQAQSAGDFAFTLIKALGWPAFDFNWGYSSLLLFLPWALVTVRTIRRAAPRSPWELWLTGMGLWVVAQALATAYARGADAPSPAFRYMDTLIVGNVVNLLCLPTLWWANNAARRTSELMTVFTVSWILLFAAGLASEAHYIWTEQLRPLLSYHHYAELNVRHYLATGDPAYLHHDEIPYPGESALRERLASPGIAERLPVSVRRPIDVQPEPALAVPAGFKREDSRVPQRLYPLRTPGAGLSPATPVLANAVTWGSYGAGRPADWRSRPIALSSQEWLKFELAGSTGLPGQELTLRAANSDRILATVKPDHTPGNSWRSAYVRAPREPFVIVAHSADAGWLAFSQPVELSAGSRAIRHWLGYGAGLVFAAGLAAVIILALPLLRGRLSALGATRSH